MFLFVDVVVVVVVVAAAAFVDEIPVVSSLPRAPPAAPADFEATVAPVEEALEDDRAKSWKKC